MQYKYAEIADTVYFWFAANDVTGTAGDGASPLYDVRLAGGAAGDAPTASGTPTLLTHANYSAGLYEIAIDTTGYAAGEYAVFCTLTISTVNPAGFCGSFKLRTAGTAALKVEPVGAVTLTSLSITNQLDAGNVLVDTTTVLTGNVTLSGTLGVVGASTLASLSITGQFDAGNVLVDTTTVLTGNVTISGTLGTGAVTLSALTVTNNALVSGTTTLTGNVSLGGTLEITGAVTLSSTLATGAVTLSALTVTNNLLVSGTSTLTGAVATGAVTMASTTVTGALTTGSIVNGGGFTQTGTFTASAFTVTNALTVGTNALPWNAAWDAEVESECDDAITASGIKGATFDTATDSLEAIRNRGDAAWITATGFSTLDAAAVTAAVPTAAAIGTDAASKVLVTPAQKIVTDASGYVTANLNGDLTATMKTSVTTAATAATPALSAAGVDAIHDEVVEGTLTLRHIAKLILSFIGGKASGGGTASIAFRDNADTKDRIVITVNGSGDRSAVTLDGA